MVNPRAAVLIDHSTTNLSESDLPEAFYPIHLRQGREGLCLLQTIAYLTEKGESFGRPFQPCLDDLLFLFGGDPERIELAVEALKQKTFLTHVRVKAEGTSKDLPELLVISPQGTKYLHEIQKKRHSGFEEDWAQIPSRVDRFLRFPKIHVFDQPEVSFFQIREITRLVTRFLKPITALNSAILVELMATAFDKKKAYSPSELYQRVIAFIDVLLRLQGDYLPYETLLEIAKLLEKHGIIVDLSKKSLYPNIRYFADFLGITEISEEVLFHKATLKALSCYCMQFRIEKQVKEKAIDLHNQVAPLNPEKVDPEAWAVGLLGTIIPRFFRIESHKRYPLSPGMWLAGRDKRQQIQKLMLQRTWQERARGNSDFS